MAIGPTAANTVDLNLTGRMMDAAEAERAGLVARVVAPEKLMEEALAAAEKIAALEAAGVRVADSPTQLPRLLLEAGYRP